MCVWLKNATRCRYLKLRYELIKLGTIPAQLGKGIFIWHKNDQAIEIIAYFADNVLWRGNTEFENVIDQLNQFFNFGSESKQFFEYNAVKLEHKQIFECIGFKLKQNLIFPS